MTPNSAVILLFSGHGPEFSLFKSHLGQPLIVANLLTTALHGYRHGTRNNPATLVLRLAAADAKNISRYRLYTLNRAAEHPHAWRYSLTFEPRKPTIITVKHIENDTLYYAGKLEPFLSRAIRNKIKHRAGRLPLGYASREEYEQHRLETAALAKERYAPPPPIPWQTALAAEHTNLPPIDLKGVRTYTKEEALSRARKTGRKKR